MLWIFCLSWKTKKEAHIADTVLGKLFHCFLLQHRFWVHYTFWIIQHSIIYAYTQAIHVYIIFDRICMLVSHTLCLMYITKFCVGVKILRELICFTLVPIKFYPWKFLRFAVYFQFLIEQDQLRSSCNSIILSVSVLISHDMVLALASFYSFTILVMK